MKNILISLVLGVSIITASALSVTTVVQPNTMTNLLTGFNQPFKLTQVIITANTNNASVLMVDSITNALTYTNAAYTNILSYATNYIATWTNFYGTTNSTTNIALIDITNSVAATTNSYPVRLGIAAVANASAKFDQVNYYFNNGIWATNTSSGIATITITGQ